MIKIEKFVVNPLGENSYLVYDETGDCVFVDPGFYYDEEFAEIKEFIASNNLKPVGIVNTHCHFDHIMGVEWLRKEYGIPFSAHEKDAFWIERAVEQGRMFGFEMNTVSPINNFLTEQENYAFGNSVFEVIHVPGHSPGHVCLYNKESDTLLAGDVIFYGSIGRTDLPGGNYQDLISNIKSKLFVLPDNTVVYSGHGPETNLGFEKSTNPFLT